MTDPENVFPFRKAKDRRRKAPGGGEPGGGPAPDPEYSQSGCEMRASNGGRGAGLYYIANSESGLYLCQHFEVSGVCLAPEENNEPARTVGILLRFKNVNKDEIEIIIGADFLQSDLGRFGQILYEVDSSSTGAT